MKNLNDFEKKFNVLDNIILNTGRWSWSVRPKQVTLGASIISLNRHASALSEVTSEEMVELSSLIKILETTMKKTFDYNIMNYLMYMMVDHHVHYHVIPRYNSTRQFFNEYWYDSGWPALPDLNYNQHTACIQQIKTFLINNI